MSTFNKVLLAALVAQAALAILLHASTDATETIRRPEPLLPGFDADAVTRVAIYEPLGEDAASGGETEAKDGAEGDPEPTIELRREGAGDSAVWKLSSHHDYPAKASEVDELLDKLAGLRSPGPAVTSQVRHGQLEVAEDQYRRKLVVETAAGTTTLFIGKPSRARQTFVRLAGEEAVHAVNGISHTGIGVLVSGWLDPTYFQIPDSDVAYMSVRNQHGFYELRRKPDDRWELVRDGAPYPVPAGKKFNSMAAKNWVKDATRITLVEPADPARAIETPLATITLRMKPKTAAPEDGDTAAGGDAAGDTTGENVAGENAAGENAAAEGTAEQPPASQPAVSEAPEEHVIVVGPASADGEGKGFYVRVQGHPNAVLARENRLRPLVDMNDDVVLIAAEE